MGEKKVIIDLDEYLDLKKKETHHINILNDKILELKEAIKNNATISIREQNPYYTIELYKTNEQFEKLYGDLFLDNYHIIGFKIRKKKQQGD